MKSGCFAKYTEMRLAFSVTIALVVLMLMFYALFGQLVPSFIFQQAVRTPVIMTWTIWFKLDWTFPVAKCSHMFYLAFENSVCLDYITEKFIRPNVLVVPVVLKRDVLRNWIPNDMFIAADDFESPRKLAEHLEYLMDNTTAYMEYLSWTQKYEIVEESADMCQLCEDLYEKKKMQIPDIIEDVVGSAECDSGFSQKLLGKQQ